VTSYGQLMYPGAAADEGQASAVVADDPETLVGVLLLPSCHHHLSPHGW